MAQSVKLNPALKTLLTVFRERCAAIQKRQNGSGGTLITTELMNELRRGQLAPLDSPNKAEMNEELKLLATLSVVIDLVTQGWRITSTEPSVMLELPECTSPENEKERIRRAHLIGRDSQILEPSVTEFVKGMEKKRLTAQGWHSIFSVMRDGEDLSRRLSEILDVQSPELQADLLSRIVRPYIQGVETDAVCS